jgi:hypothetical protein
VVPSLEPTWHWEALRRRRASDFAAHCFKRDSERPCRAPIASRQVGSVILVIEKAFRVLKKTTLVVNLTLAAHLPFGVVILNTSTFAEIPSTAG